MLKFILLQICATQKLQDFCNEVFYSHTHTQKVAQLCDLQVINHPVAWNDSSLHALSIQVLFFN